METDLLSESPERPEVAAPDVLPGANQLVDWIRSELSIAKPHVEKFREEYRKAKRFFDGKHLTKEDLQVLQKEQRPHNMFNAAAKFVRFVTGIERVAPEDLLFSAIDENDQRQQAYSEFVTRAYDWAIDKGKGNFERSEAFLDLILGGMGWETYYIDYGQNPNGLPAMRRFSPLEAWWPQTSRQNLEGARWRAWETYIDKQEALARWPEDKFIINLASFTDISKDWPQATGVTEFIVYPTQTKPLKDSDTQNPDRNKLLIMQFEWYDDEMGYYFFDPLEQEDIWMSRSDFQIYQRRIRQYLGVDIGDKIERPARTYKRVFVLNRRYQLGEVIKLRRFHLNCMTGSYDEEERIFYGYFRVLIDPTKYANKFYNQVLEIMGHAAKGGGFLYEEGVFDTKQKQDFQDNFSKPGTSQEVKRNAISERRIIPKQQGEFPQSAFSMLQFCVQMMENVTGLAPDQLGGGPSANVPGVTLRQKAKSSLILLSPEFDALARYRIDEGYIILDLLESLADDRLVRIGGHADGEVVKLIHQPFEVDYELSLDDTERDPNVRRMYQENVMAIAPILIRQGWFLPELLDYMLIPFRFKRALQEAMKRKAQEDIALQRQGIKMGGRGASMTPEERQAKIQKTAAETQVQLARAERLRTQSKRDEVRTIMEALIKAMELQLAKEKHGSEQASKALELFQRAVTGGAVGRQ